MHLPSYKEFYVCSANSRVALTTRNVHRTLLYASSLHQVPMKVGVCDSVVLYEV